MNRPDIGRLFCGVAGLLIAFSASAATWYVDDDNYGKPDLDGKTEASAFGTIKDALENAGLKAHDTVMVLPGVYSNDTMYVQGHSRVAVNKPVNLISRDGKEVTHIVGGPDPVTKACGANAIRCIGVSHLAKDTVIKGFTIRDGYTTESSGGSDQGGAVYVNNDSTWIVDCVVSNCTSMKAAMFKGTAVRTWFTCNRSATDKGYSVGHSMNMHSCLVSGNDAPSSYLMHMGNAVNTTFAVNATNGLGVAGGSSAYMNLYNCIVLIGDKCAYANYNNCSIKGYSLIAPALNDFRVKAGGPADGTGNRKWLEGEAAAVQLPPDEPLLDFNGKPYLASGAIHMGCIQETVEAKGGLLHIEKGLSIEGYPAHPNASYFYPVSYPCQYRVLPNLSSGERVVCYNFSPATRNWRLPEADDGITVMPPPLTGGQYSEHKIIARKTDAIIHVAMPENGGDDIGGDGSKEKPFATIQKAVDSAVDDVHTLILVGSGTYGEGEAHYLKDANGNDVVAYGKASVTVGKKKRVRILGEEGAERTMLKGTADPDYASADALPGCGPKAGRCILFADGDVGNGIQGFTLTGGCSARAKNADVDKDGAYLGGGWFSASGLACIADCIVSNNVANTYAAGAAGVLDRLYVTENLGSGTVGNHPLLANACVFVDNPSARSSYGVIGGDSRAYNCTIIESDANAKAAYNIYSARIHNSIIMGGNTLGNSTELKNTILYGQPALPSSVGFFYGDPNFVDVDSGDYRVKSYSPATRLWAPSDALFYQHAATDFCGNRIVSEDGKVVVGAFAETVSAMELYVKADKGGVAVTGGNIGGNVITDRTVTLTPANGMRPCIGYLVNGATNLFADLPGGKLAITPEQVEAAGGISVEMIYDNNWYADAENGDDSNPGFVISPKKTLAAAMAMAVSGDVVHAAPGDYNEGLMGQDPTCMISSRVVVASGVLLKADQGPEVTFITGADATINPMKGTYAGCGTNAVRCVYLSSNSRIQGFTVRHGRFRGDSPDSDDTRSGGICGRNVDLCIAQECVITDCMGYRGGALYGTTAVRCRIFDCTAADGSAGKIVYMHGCVIGAVNNGVSHPKILSNCTFLPECKSPLSAYFTESTPVRNSIIIGSFTAKESNPVHLYNCVVAEGAISDAVAPYVHMTDCVVTNIEAIALAADGSITKDSCAVDFGSNAYVSEHIVDMDFVGGQRIYNGRVDAGAYEFDWRDKYASTILAKRCTVCKASPEVLQGEGKVLVNGTLDTEIIGSGNGCRYLVEIPVKVTGNGVLYVVKNGETAASYDLADGEQTFSYKSLNASESLSFVYEPGESDTGCAEIGSAKMKSFAFTVILR